MDSGEDWWYDHKNSYDLTQLGQPLNGYICAGYSNFRNYAYIEANGGCLSTTLPPFDCKGLETMGNVRGSNSQTLALIKPDGSNHLWFEKYNDGVFNSVIQTSDGGYLAIGVTGSTRTPNGNALFYNPNQQPSAVTDQFDLGTACVSGGAKGHISLVKTSANGAVQWQFIYGMQPYRNASGIPAPEDAYANQAEGFDVVETPSGSFRMVGQATDLANSLARAFMIEVGPNGHWLWGEFIGPATDTSNAIAITKYGTGSSLRYLVSGPEIVSGAQKAYLTQFDGSSPPLNVLWKKIIPTVIGNQSTHDVQVNANGEILFPIIVDCTGCLWAGYNSGEARVYRLNASNGFVISHTSFGQVTAFDLKLRITPTADGGYGLVSSKQVTPPPAPFGCYDTSYWNTDTYVAKVNACGNIEWETTFDVDNNPPANYPSNLKKQECMYSISQGDDGGFVVSGNNSYNFDDNYLVKLNPATPVTADLFMRDTPLDIGLEPNPDNGPMWVSDDIWVRQDPNDGFWDHTSLNAEYGIANYIYVRVKNRGCQPMSGELKVYWTLAATGLSWAQHWDNYVPTVTGCAPGLFFGNQVPGSITISNLLPNQQSIYMLQQPWFPPNPADYTCFTTDTGHFCLLARIETSTASPFGMTFPETSDVYHNTKQNNNIVWKNITVVANFPRIGSEIREPVIVRNVSDRAAVTKLSFDVPKEEGNNSFYRYGAIRIDLGEKLFRKWQNGGMKGGGVEVIGRNSIIISDPAAWIGNIGLDSKEMQAVRVRFQLRRRPPANTKNSFTFNLSQSITEPRLNKVIGGVSFAIKTERPKKKETPTGTAPPPRRRPRYLERP